MLKLVAKGFYKELIKYGVKEPEILTVAEHLLDNVALKSNPNQIPLDTYNHLLRTSNIENDWEKSQTLSIDEISLSPLLESDCPTVAQWTTTHEAKRYFYPQFPNTIEMRKLIGDSSQRGKGIGKRATFLFLYYTFLIANREKVFLHSLDVNLRNLTLNGKFGFYLEGVFFEDIIIDGVVHDVARMALTMSVWLKLFG